jgi:hypothetical protein
MEIFTTILLLIISLTFSIYLITNGIKSSKKIIDELKNGQN